TGGSGRGGRGRCSRPGGAIRREGSRAGAAGRWLDLGPGGRPGGGRGVREGRLLPARSRTGRARGARVRGGRRDRSAAEVARSGPSPGGRRERMTRIAVIPGDGIGVEVTREAVECLRTASRVTGRGMDLDPLPYGADHYLKTGETLPAAALDSLRA